MLPKSVRIEKTWDWSFSRPSPGINSGNMGETGCESPVGKTVGQKSGNMPQGTGHLVRHAGNKPYRCTVCKYRCRLKHTMVNHFRIHSGEKPYKCSICHYAATFLSSLNGHMKRMHPNAKPFQCTVCNQTFITHFRLRQHLKRHTADNAFKCSICDYSCHRRADLTQHLWAHAGIKPFKCTVCDYAAAWPQNVRHHMELHHPGSCINRFKCSVCEESFSDRPRLKRHLRIHGTKPYKCTICDYSSNRRSNLELHCRRHSEERPYQCTVCDYSAKFMYLLDRHMRNMHPSNEYLKCSICHVTFGRRRALSQHMRLHTIEHIERKTEDKPPNAATIVKHSPAGGKVSKYNVDTDGHPSTVHSGNLHAAGYVGPNKIGNDEDRDNGVLSTADVGRHNTNCPGDQLQCDVCSKRFDTEMMLSQHLRRVHIKTGLTENTSKALAKRRKMTPKKKNQERGTPNGNCGMSARYGPHCTERPSSPTRRHLQGKSYQCPFCDYTSRHKGTLETHYRRHTGEKPFKCRICDYSAIQSTPLYAHMKKVHPGTKPFKCNACGEILADLRQLRRHRNLAHGKNAEAVSSWQPSRQTDEAERLKSKDLQEMTGNEDRGAHNGNIDRDIQNEYSGEADISNHHTVHHGATADISLQTNRSVKSNTIQGPCPGQEGQYFCNADMTSTTETGSNTGKPGGLSGYHTRQRGVLLHHSSRQVIYNFKCTICSYSCKMRQHLEDHLRLHTGEKPFKCRVCGYAAAIRSNVHSHMKKKHPSVRPFICTVCNKAFGTAKRLRHHSRLHPGATASKMTPSATSKLKIKDHNMTSNTHQRPLTQVKATVAHNIERDAQDQKRHCTRHRRKPSGSRSRYLPAKPYKCPVCTYSCSLRSNLAVHVRIHSGEKPYKCTLCDYSTGYNSSFYVHMRKQHPGANLLKCTVCGAGFITPRKLMMHLKLHMGKGTGTVTAPVEDHRNQNLRKLPDSTRCDSRDQMHFNITDLRRTASMPCDSAENHENDTRLPGADDLHENHENDTRLPGDDDLHTLTDVDGRYQCDVCNKR